MRKKRTGILATAGVSLAAALTITGLAVSAARATSPVSATALSSVVFGTNMPLFDGNEQMLSNTGTQAIIKGWHTPVIRVPFRTGLSDSVELQALQTVKNIGAAPLVIIHGAADSNVLSDDTHLLALTAQVFGSSTVYVEYGNEEDLAGIGAQQYTTSWNATIPSLKAAHPSYKYIGPVNFQQNPGYIGYFVGHANPLPDLVSWHEYVCGPIDATTICFSHLANWKTHVTNTNNAEVAAIGHTIPFFISEWNMDPQNDPRYLNQSVIGPWTTQAIQEMESLVPMGLAGAQQYCADSHGGGFELIDSSNNLTYQGAAFQGAMGPSPSPSPTTPSPSPTTPSPSPTTPSPSPTQTSPSPSPSPTPGSIRYDFENGTTQGWAPAFGSITDANSTVRAWSGTHSLAITSTGGYQAVRGSASLTAGTQVTYHVWSPAAGVHVVPFVTAGWTNTFASGVTLAAGWNIVTWKAPVAAAQAGLQVNTFTGTLYLDAVSW